MLSREENELLTRVGPGTPMGELCAATGCPRCSPRSCPSPTARRCACGCWARTWSPSATRRAGRPARRSTARTAAPRCSSGATRSAACAASTTAGSSTSTGNCVDMPTEPPESELQGQGPPARLPVRGDGRRDLGLHGPARAPSRRSRAGVDARCPAATATSPRRTRSATTCRRIEGGIDTVALLVPAPRVSDRRRTLERGTERYRAASKAPRLEVQSTTDYGFTYAGIRALDEDDADYVRVYHFVMPFHQMRAFEGYDGGPARPGPHVGADRRRAHLGLQLDVRARRLSPCRED